MVDLFLSCNRRIQTKIWLGDWGTYNWLHLYPLADWTSQSLDEVRTLFQIFWVWTHVIISRRSKTDNYKCPLCFPLWQEVGISPPGIMGSRRLREKEESRLLGSELRLSVLLHFLFSYGEPLQAGRVLSARPIRCCVDQKTVAFWRGATLEVGAAN